MACRVNTMKMLVTIKGDTHDFNLYIKSKAAYREESCRELFLNPYPANVENMVS
jgi:hypothetical protein